VNVGTGNILSELKADSTNSVMLPSFSKNGEAVYGIADTGLNVWDISDLISRVPNAELLEN